MSRRHNFQTVSWFNDLYTRKLLELNPPYQRRSVWSLRFKEYFIDTILLQYPAPAIFLYEEISSEGSSVYNVVDGKQRLSTIFEFVNNEFTVSESSPISNLRGKYFSQLDSQVKKDFWSYQFLIEYLPDSEESLINDIFDRINRNVAKLTPQELRHAKLDGVFISAAEELTAWMLSFLPNNFPRFDAQSKKQMKDVEFVAILLLLLEEGPRSYSQADLDRAFTERDEAWDLHEELVDLFRSTVHKIKNLATTSGEPNELTNSRLRNQADFYSIFGAVSELLKAEVALPSDAQLRSSLMEFINRVDSQHEREKDSIASEYYQAARSASNDKGPREKRIKIIKDLLQLA